MKDVAAVAGVSLSTVSRVVNGSPPVDPELAVKVEHAVEMLGYRHNHTAGTLRRANGLSASIGLILEDVSNPFFAAIHRGVEEVARERSVVAFAGSSDEDPDRERELIEAVLGPPRRRADHRADRQRPHATCCATSPPASASCSSTALRWRSTPTACSARIARAPTSRSRICSPTAIAGSRFIGFSAVRHTAIERLAGYRRALGRAGVEGELTRFCEHAGEARELALGLLRGPAPPTALFSAQNLITIEVLRALYRARAPARDRA